MFIQKQKIILTMIYINIYTIKNKVMIVDKEVIMKCTNSNYKYYREKGLDVKQGEFFSTPVEYLTKGVRIKILVACDICGNQKSIIYSNYLKYTNNLTQLYHCNNCSQLKVKETLMEKYGVENNFQREDVKEKIKQTNLLNFGVEHPSQNEKVKEKQKNTCLERYGVETNLLHIDTINKIKEHNILKYGVDHFSKTDEYKEKMKETYLNRYGVDHYSKTDEFKEKVKETNILKWGYASTFQNIEVRNKWKENFKNKYGVEYPLQYPEFKQKIKSTNLEKYGFEYPTQNNIVKHKTQETCLNRYNFNTPLQNPLIKDKIKLTNETNTLFKYDTLINKEEFEILSYNDSIFNLYHKECSNSFSINRKQLYDRLNNDVNICTKCYPIDELTSIKEKEVLNWIKSLDIENIICSDRLILEGKELDIYLPKYNLAIEFNGYYWHSDKFKEKNYHLDKTVKCKDKGIDLIHIFENDWSEKQDVIKSIILKKLNMIEQIDFNKLEHINNIYNCKEFIFNNSIKRIDLFDDNLIFKYNEDIVLVINYTIKDDIFIISEICEKIGYSINKYGLIEYIFNNFKINNIHFYSNNNICENLKGFAVYETYINSFEYDNSIIYDSGINILKLF